MRNKRFSWKHTFVALAISFVVCLLIVVVMTTATKRDLPEFFLRYLRTDRPRRSHGIHEHAESLSPSRTVSIRL